MAKQTKDPKKPGKSTPSADEAKLVYLSQGSGRKLIKVALHYEQHPDFVAPSLSTLKQWSTEQKWQAAAKEHDAQVTAKASEIAITEGARKRVDAAGEIEVFAVELIEKARELLAKVESPDKLEALVNLTVLLLTKHQELEGRTTAAPDPLGQGRAAPDDGVLKSSMAQALGETRH